MYMDGKFDLRSTDWCYKTGYKERSRWHNGKGESLCRTAETRIFEAKNYKGEASTKIEAGIADLKTKQDQAKQKLQEVGSSTGAAWDDMKAGLDKAVADLQKAYNDASSHFKQK
jgi:hypothetical protein